MKIKPLLVVAGLLLLHGNVFSQDTNFFIFLCFGQSNMEGFPGIEQQDKAPVDERFQVLAAVDFPPLGRMKGRWYAAVPPLCRPSTGLCPADYFGRTLVSNLPPNTKVGIVNVSVAGCKIELFQKDTFRAYASTAPTWMSNIINAYGGNPYQHLVEMARLAQKDGIIKGILLHQGESNTNDKEWPNKVKGIYENLLNDLNLKAEEVPLLAGELVGADQKGACASMNRIIDDLPKTIPTAHVISSKGCAGRPDHLHFIPAGYRELGKRYGETMLPLLGYESSAIPDLSPGDVPKTPNTPPTSQEKIFMDYFLPTPAHGELVRQTWGAPSVLPRDPQNGLEDSTLEKYCYWDGQIIKAPDGKYHMFASRWNESRGHNGWFGSVAVHAVSDSLTGPYADKGLCWPNDQNGKGHNVTALTLPDGRYAIIISETRPCEVYVSKSLDGPWDHLGTITVEGDPRWHASNVAIMARPDGNFEFVPRDGRVFFSDKGILGPYQPQGESVFPKGIPNLEDPCIWYSGGLYHIVVNSWSTRKAYHLTSRDGIRDWTNRGMAYDPREAIVRYPDGTVNHWNKAERPSVYIENGHVAAMTLAVIDVEKEKDKGNDGHGSKVIVIPFDGAALDHDLGLAQQPQTKEPTDDWKPAVSNQPGKQYPQVNSEGRVRVRVVAPQAQSVRFEFLGGAKYPLSRGEDGAWSGFSNPQDEGFHYYQLVIDGAQVPDPGTLYFYGGGRWGSGIEIPAKDQDFYALKNVPHGQLREIHYFSKSSNSTRRCFVYTPPDYDRDPNKRFPALYLQHGMGEDETGWGNQGHANLIMDNLIAEGKAKPFIIVMENGGGIGPRRGGAPAPNPAASGITNGIAASGGRGGFNFSAFERVLIDDLIPYIDGTYRTLDDQPHRAMAGLSMGGMQTRAISLANLDKFSQIGVFSGGSIALTNITDITAFKQKVKLVFVSYGSREVDPARRSASGRGPFGGDPKANTDALKQAGINSHYYVSPQTAHEWQSWRRSLYQFAPLLFQD